MDREHGEAELGALFFMVYDKGSLTMFTHDSDGSS